MGIDRGPILTVAAPHEVRQRRHDAARSRRVRNGPSTPTADLAPRRDTAGCLVDRGRDAFSGWLLTQALRRAWLDAALDR